MQRIDSTSLGDLLPEVIATARAAGDRIMEVYAGGFDVEAKGDGSPLTTADRHAHELICARLGASTADIPVLSEESAELDLHTRQAWPTFWLVDPLDGTKEFIKRNGEFTVNIALVCGTEPVLGVVCTPAQSLVHYAAVGVGAYRVSGDEAPTPIHTRGYRGGSAVVVASRSHASPRLQQFMGNLQRAEGEAALLSMGSALKLCLVAEGRADVYPRLGPTSEWDVAAAHCVVEVAGGAVFDLRGERLRYNKESLLNPWFLAVGDRAYAWRRCLEGITES